LIKIRGIDYTDREQLQKKLLEEAAIGKISKEGPTERAVMIRADAAAEYGLVQQVMLQCVMAGFYKTEMGARIAKSKETARR
jgi:biopolymer transport protein ExbD